MYKMQAVILRHLELFCQLTRKKRVKEYEWLLAINSGHLILFSMFCLFVMNCHNEKMLSYLKSINLDIYFRKIMNI